MEKGGSSSKGGGYARKWAVDLTNHDYSSSSSTRDVPDPLGFTRSSQESVGLSLSLSRVPYIWNSRSFLILFGEKWLLCSTLGGWCWRQPTEEGNRSSVEGTGTHLMCPPSPLLFYSQTSFMVVKIFWEHLGIWSVTWLLNWWTFVGSEAYEIPAHLVLIQLAFDTYFSKS